MCARRNWLGTRWWCASFCRRWVRTKGVQGADQRGADQRGAGLGNGEMGGLKLLQLAALGRRWHQRWQ